jgi:hypothetical protein
MPDGHQGVQRGAATSSLLRRGGRLRRTVPSADGARAAVSDVVRLPDARDGLRCAPMEGSEFTEEGFFAAIASSGARALLIGRRAILALGVPVLTADYDLWAAFEDVEVLNAALAPMGLHPNRTPEEARRTGRYVLENDEHVDVLVARAATAATGEKLSFDDAWSRRQTVRCGEADVALPNIDDLITTKRWSMRAKDVLDIQLIEALRRTPT